MMNTTTQNTTTQDTTKQDTTKKGISTAKALLLGDLHSIVHCLIRAKDLNHIRLTEYSAQDKGSAGIRHNEGESGRGKGQHVGQEFSHKILSFSHNALGYLVRINVGMVDKTSRKGDKYGVRSFILYDGHDEKRDNRTFQYCINFGQWQTYDWTGKRSFPQLPDNPAAVKAIERSVIKNHIRGLCIEALANKTKSMKQNKPAKAGCETPAKVYNRDGATLRLSYEACGKIQSKKLIDLETGEGVPNVKRDVPRALLLPPMEAFQIESHYPNWCGEITRGKLKGQIGLVTDYELLPLYVQELDRLRSEYVILAKAIRPFELGLIDDAMRLNEDHVSIGSTVFEVVQNMDSESDPDPRAEEMIEKGLWKRVDVERNGKGKWTLTEVKKSVKA